MHLKKASTMTSLINNKLFYFARKQVFYKKKRITVRERVENINVFRSIIRALWKQIHKELIDREGGVVLEGIGYLAHWMCPKKRVVKGVNVYGFTLFTQEMTGGYFYYTSLFPDIFENNPLDGWMIDAGINYKLKQHKYEKLKTGHKYKFYYTMLKHLYSDQEFD